MADTGPENSECLETEENTKMKDGSDDSNIHDFVRQEYERQREESGDDQIDADRIKNFFTRAVSESQRMNREVDKSHERLFSLHTELGAERFTQWRQEHASQALTQHQAQLVETAANSTAQEMDQS